MKSVVTSIRPSHSRTLRATNSGPLSDRMCSGVPWATNRSVRQEHVVGPELARHDDGQAATRELVDHSEHAKASPVLGAVLHEVIRPDVIGPLRSQADAGAVIEPEAPALGLYLWHFQPFPPPDAVDALDDDLPAFVDQQSADAPVAVAAIPRRKGTIASVRAASSARTFGCRRCVERDWPTTEHARRSDSVSCERT